MPRTSYQYETSPRKYEPEYTRRVTTTKTKTSQTKKGYGKSVSSY